MNSVRAHKVGWAVLIAIVGITLLAPCGAGATAKIDGGTTPRILLMGDSWPWFLSTGFAFWTYERGSAFRDILPETGRGQWSDDAATAIAGSMITQWSTNEPTPTPYGVLGKLDYARRELMEFPTIDIVHLCLGGNDFIRGDFRGYVHTEPGGPLYQEYQWQTLVNSGEPSGGTFTVTFQGQTTGPIPYGSDASVVQAELEGLSTIGTGNIAVSNATGGARYFCAFQGAFAGSAVPAMSANGSGLTGISPAITAYPVIFDHGWKQTWGTESPAEYAFAEAILEQLQIVAEYALDTRPDIRLVLHDYDYMDQGVGGATPHDANAALVNGGHIKLMLMETLRARPEYANRVFFLDAYGLMQWTFGYPCDFTEPTLGERVPATLPEDQYYQPMGQPGTMGTISLPGTFPDYTPWAGGDLNYPGPAIAILFDFGKKDSDPSWAKDMAKGGNIHLHKLGNHVYARYCVQQYYGAWLDQPKVISVKRATYNPMQPGQIYDPAGLSQVAFEVTFSEPVNGVDDADFAPIVANGLAAASIQSVEEGKAGSTYTVVVNSGSGDGTLGLRVIDNGSITAVDDGTPLAGDVDGSFSYGETYTINRAFGVPLAAWPVALALLAAGCCIQRRRR